MTNNQLAVVVRTTDFLESTGVVRGMVVEVICDHPTRRGEVFIYNANIDGYSEDWADLESYQEDHCVLIPAYYLAVDTGLIDQRRS